MMSETERINRTNAERPCDQQRGYRLRLHRFDDCDIQVLIEDENCSSKLVVFREPLRGGGCSPRTHAALLELMAAMQQDTEERSSREQGWIK